MAYFKAISHVSALFSLALQAVFSNLLTMTPVVLLLSTYPFQEPRHGGQIRLASLALMYKMAGWIVESIAIYEPEGYDEAKLGEKDIAFPKNSPYRSFRGDAVPLINDLLTGPYAAAEDGAFPRIKRLLPKRITAIHVEQPWLWPLATKIRGLVDNADVILIYGSQNIESSLKRDIFASNSIKAAHSVIQEIDRLERTACAQADLCLAVTSADFETLGLLGAEERLIAANGIAPWKASRMAVTRWQKLLPAAPFILYVASAHPPNFTGFVRCVGDALGSIPPDSKLVVAGSVCEHIYRCMSSTAWHSLNLSRLQLLNLLPDDDLAAVKSLAQAFLLPIEHGGGSNIKTAEALYSGAFVIGTTAAFRGYEPFKNLPEVLVADSPSEFQRDIRAVLLSKKLGVDLNKNSMRASLTWEATLAAVPQALTKIMTVRKK